MSVVFAFPGNEAIAASLSKDQHQLGEFTWRHFPDGESYLRIHSEVSKQHVIIVCSLNEPDRKTIPLLFLAKTARSLGAQKISLYAPYLAYMRQDRVFHSGEGINAKYYAELLSATFDEIVTIDPHLHRQHDLSDVYSIENKVLHATKPIGEWILQHVKSPLLLGPDEESEQWLSEISRTINAPYICLTKQRFGDQDVTLAMPDLSEYKQHHVVLVDDIISSGGTMLEAIKLLAKQGFSKPMVIVVHPIFAQDSYQKLQQVSANVISCNTISHASNEIDIANLFG